MVQTFIKGDHRTILKISGNVLYVIRGEVDPTTLLPVRLEDFRFALGAGSPQKPECCGETIVIERRPYISWVEKKKLVTRESPLFHSPFLMGIDDKQILGALIHSQPTPPAPLTTLYAELGHRYPTGFALLGCALFAESHTTYLKKAPVYRQNINEHHSDYWAPVKKDSQQNGCLFGVVIPETARAYFPEEILSRGFYRNPKESPQASDFDSHTHLALLEQGPEKWPHNMNEFFKSLRNLPVTGVRHLLTSSVLQEATFAVFPLEKIVIA
jgi:hypothetical protein